MPRLPACGRDVKNGFNVKTSFGMFASVIWVIAELEGDKRVFGNRDGSSRSVTYNDNDRLLNLKEGEGNWYLRSFECLSLDSARDVPSFKLTVSLNSSESQ